MCDLFEMIKCDEHVHVRERDGSWMYIKMNIILMFDDDTGWAYLMTITPNLVVN